jgi:hypothetical protein
MTEMRRQLAFEGCRVSIPRFKGKFGPLEQVVKLGFLSLVNQFLFLNFAVL